MPSTSIAAESQTTPHPASGRWALHRHRSFRVLLALDGHKLTQGDLALAHQCCRLLSDRLDILVVRPTKAPTFLLGELLIRLEWQGIDYRLTVADGDLDDAVLSYLHRFQGIKTIVVNGYEVLPEAVLADLRDQGYRLLTLAEPGFRDVAHA